MQANYARGVFFIFLDAEVNSMRDALKLLDSYLENMDIIHHELLANIGKQSYESEHLLHLSLSEFRISLFPSITPLAEGLSMIGHKVFFRHPQACSNVPWRIADNREILVGRDHILTAVHGIVNGPIFVRSKVRGM